MSGYKLADGTLSTDYKEGQAFKFHTPERSDELNSNWSTISLNGTLKLYKDDGTRCPEFKCIETGEISYEEWGYLVTKQSNSQPETYTQSELSYIHELEDRVEYLDSLCSDLAEHIEDVEYKLEQRRKALSKWFKLTQLISENNKVADLIGARLGDDVIDIIYDYLLSRVK